MQGGVKLSTGGNQIGGRDKQNLSHFDTARVHEI